MPEILTRHPDIVLKVLKSQGAECGTGAKQKILTKCPPEKFCALAGGELCIFGSSELGKMTQLAPTDVCKTAATSSEGVMLVDPLAARDIAPTMGQMFAGVIPIAIAILLAGYFGLRRK